MRLLRSREDILVDLKRILFKDHGIRPEKVFLTSIIPDDLGVDGADAWELIDRVNKHWNICLKLEFLDHFGPESGFFQEDPPDPMTVSGLVDKILQAIAANTANEEKL